MALTLSEGSVIKVTGTATSSEKITDKLTYVRSVYWYAPSAAAHLVNLVDKEGFPIITMKGTVDGSDAGQSQQWIINAACNGIYCDDMDSGTLFIYTR